MLYPKERSVEDWRSQRVPLIDSDDGRYGGLHDSLELAVWAADEVAFSVM
ncbi:MAG TPA: hypothetical protein VG963_29330 [Polyangiaceae bacterium]|nr:hypothetical protein [Polyangiaceae bacterium]